MSTDTVEDSIFRALAAPVRRRILDALRDGPMTTSALCVQMPQVDRCTVMQHLGVLEAAGLVIAQRKGRERWNHLNALPIKAIHDRWIAPYAQQAVTMLDRLRQELGA
jgi:DNA-binding transcriptional ArsR family regulator